MQGCERRVRWRWVSKGDVRARWDLLNCNLDDRRQDGRGGRQKADELSTVQDRTDSLCLLEEAEKSAGHICWRFNPGLREGNGSSVLQHNLFYQSMYRGSFGGVLHYHGTLIIPSSNSYAPELNSHQMGLEWGCSRFSR